MQGNAYIHNGYFYMGDNPDQPPKPKPIEIMLHKQSNGNYLASNPGLGIYVGTSRADALGKIILDNPGTFGAIIQVSGQ